MRGANKAPLPRTVEAGSSIMHDSDIFRWTTPDAGAFRLTDRGQTAGRRRPVPQQKENSGLD
jgi:hypothetical protein